MVRSKKNIRLYIKISETNLQKSSTTTIHKVQVQIKKSTVQRRLKFFNFKKY